MSLSEAFDIYTNSSTLDFRILYVSSALLSIMEPFFEPTIRLRPRLRDNTLTATSLPVASGSDNKYMSRNEQNLRRQAGNITSRPDTNQQFSIRTTYGHILATHATPATHLSDIFPILFESGPWNQASHICIQCEVLGRWLYITTQHPRTSTIDYMNLLDTIECEALGGCGNCLFMIDCLRQAAFSPESSKVGTRRLRNHYQLIARSRNSRKAVTAPPETLGTR